MSDINAMVKAAIQAQVVMAFKEMPDAIDKLVQAALTQDVDKDGRPTSSGYGTKPYLDYLVNDIIRQAARDAVREVVKSEAQKVAQSVASKISVETLVAGLAEKILGVVSDDWKIEVTFRDK